MAVWSGRPCDRGPRRGRHLERAGATQRRQYRDPSTVPQVPHSGQRPTHFGTCRHLSTGTAERAPASSRRDGIRRVRQKRSHCESAMGYPLWRAASPVRDGQLRGSSPASNWKVKLAGETAAGWAWSARREASVPPVLSAGAVAPSGIPTISRPWRVTAVSLVSVTVPTIASIPAVADVRRGVGGRETKRRRSLVPARLRSNWPDGAHCAARCDRCWRSCADRGSWAGPGRPDRNCSR